MGNIKDLIDLITQLNNRVEDRKIAAELQNIQGLSLSIQAEQTKLHEENTKLREEKLSQKERIRELEDEIFELKSAPSDGQVDEPKCPNCSSKSKPFYMKPLPKDFIEITGSTHECSKCGYEAKVVS